MDLPPTDVFESSFTDEGLVDILDASPVELFDRAGFGIVVMDRSDVVVGYNLVESALSGLPRDRVVGRNFFTTVAPCTDNGLVAGRYHACAELDEQLDYVFTFRVRAVPVRLRLLARTSSPRQYLAVLPR
jgi:photoactive yellow protein